MECTAQVRGWKFHTGWGLGEVESIVQCLPLALNVLLQPKHQRSRLNQMNGKPSSIMPHAKRRREKYGLDTSVDRQCGQAGDGSMVLDVTIPRTAANNEW